MFPAEPILLARGKYATLGSEKRVLLKRIHSACSLLMHEASQIMRDSEKDIPTNGDYLKGARACLSQAEEARSELIKVCEQMDEIRDLAWGTMDYDDKSPKEPA